MKKLKYIGYLILITAAVNACKKPYNPKIVGSPNSYLVVEGIINSGGDSTIIKLSKTVNLGDDVKTNLLSNYTVTVESEQGDSYNLQPAGNGMYVAPSLPIDVSKKYRLHIITNDNGEYASDYEAVKKTQPIDSISYQSTTGVHIAVSTHDPNNSSRYYRWSFQETWKFHAKYQSNYIVDADTKMVRTRTPAEQIYNCYAGDASSVIVIGSSAKLTQDVIFENEVTIIPPNSEKLGIRYSILVKQYALTKEAYQFWENMKKNTEQLGSIFDAQPSQISGNIHNVKNPLEPVIGYLSVTNTTSKRIYITPGQVSNGYTSYPYDCSLDSALYSGPNGENQVQENIIDGTGIPVGPILPPMAVVPAGYTFSSKVCTDCTIRGAGKAPIFWTE